MTDNDQWRSETRAIRGGRVNNDFSLAPVLWPSTTYFNRSVDENFSIARSTHPSKFYSRNGSPTVLDFEDAVAELEGAEAALAFGSGMGAISTVILTFCGAGDHVVAQSSTFSVTNQLFTMLAPRLGIDVTFVDAMLGVIAGERDLIAAVWVNQLMVGAVCSPFDAWNALRGIRTLHARVRQQSETAQALAEFLESHPAVARVVYPGLESHPQRDIAKRQMTNGGTVLTFELAGGLEAGRQFVEQVEVAQVAPSLGGPETLVVHPPTMTAATLTPEER